ncbi:hypothetical protein ACQCP9_26105, partial [Ralstonia pseudosolanacearum]|uniref:hypothetical protein n=1 Tax=Ralstonia pseudosolanacearum TaxID=1310165 RepID=UPI003CEA61E6
EQKRQIQQLVSYRQKKTKCLKIPFQLMEERVLALEQRKEGIPIKSILEKKNTTTQNPLKPFYANIVRNQEKI